MCSSLPPIPSHTQRGGLRDCSRGTEPTHRAAPGLPTRTRGCAQQGLNPPGQAANTAGSREFRAEASPGSDGPGTAEDRVPALYAGGGPVVQRSKAHVLR